MVTILHISDLHFFKHNAGTNNMREILLNEAEERTRAVPQGQKLLIVTGDFHNFDDGDYTDATGFLTELVEKMGLRMAQDVFVVPGNHDVGNEQTLAPLLGSDKRWKQHQENTRSAMEQRGVTKENLEERLEAFLPYCNFVKALGLYSDTDPLYPATAHVRCWDGAVKLNLLHLNTALIYDGHSKGGQLADVAAASDDANTWRGVPKDIPALALGHNHFYDLKEETRNQLLPVFLHRNVSAYLCGDAHRSKWNLNERNILLTDGLAVPNIVCAKSIADANDDYSEFGFYWLDWDTEQKNVRRRFRFWKPEEGAELSTREAPSPFPMRGASPMPPVSPPEAPNPDPAADLRAHLAETLRKTRDAHPSFRLIAVDEIDQKLFPGIRETEFAHIPAQCSVGSGGPVSPVWDIVRESWKTKPVPNVVIEGEGGIGKTTALFSLCNAQKPDVPAVYVPMHQLLRKDGTLIDISDYLTCDGRDKDKFDKVYGPQIRLLFSTTMGERPNLLVLLDGFNEVPQDKREDMLDAVNDWYLNHHGAQLVAVSRPMDGLNLGKELAGKPLAVTLAPLEREVIRRYLKDYDREIPLENAPIWKVLCYPLFLTLYLKTGALKGKSSARYPLAPKQADSGGALIWNFLQRELLRQTDEGWVLRCAVACEYLLPRIAWEMTERHSFVLDQDEAIQWTEQALAELDAKALPKHLAALFRTYERKHAKKRGTLPDFSGVDWPRTVLHDCGLLVPYQEEERDETGADGPARYALMHQNFRDCLAALHLLNAAEAAKRGLPRLWRRSHDPYVLDYAAELAEADTAARLWEALRTLRPTNSAAVCTQLELQKRRGDGRTLDFSGMDLRGLSLAPYLRKGEGGLSLFRSAALSAGTALERNTFRFQGHNDRVNCVAVLSDGRIVSGSKDGTLRVWDSGGGACLHVLEGHSGSVYCVAALPEGRIVSGSDDWTLRVWDSVSGECLQVLEGHSALVTCVVALPEGRIVSGSGDRTLRVWDSVSGECLQVLEGHSDWVDCVAALPDGRIVSGSFDGTLRVWDNVSGECLQVLEGHSALVCCVAALPDGRIVSGSDDGTLRVWDIGSGKCLQVLEGHSALVRCVAALPEGRIVSGSRDETLRVWDIESGACLQVLKGYERSVNCVAALPDGRIVSGLDDGTLRVWDSGSGKCLQVLKEHRGSVYSLAALPDGRIVSVSDDGTLRVWDNGSRVCLRVLEGHSDWVRCMAALPDGRIISGSDDRTLRVWDSGSGECLQVLKGHSAWVFCMAALPEGRIVSGSVDRTLRVWDSGSGECLHVLEGHSAWVTCVAALPDGRIVSGSADGTLRVWDSESGDCLQVLKGHKWSVHCVAALPDGRIVSGSADGTLRVWDSGSGECLQVLEGHKWSVDCVAALPNGRIVSGSIDGTLRIWDPDTGKCLDILTPMDVDVRGMDFSRAILTPDLAKQLWQNGAKISDADYQNHVLRKP